MNALNANKLKVINKDSMLDYVFYKQNKLPVDEFMNNIEFTDIHNGYLYIFKSLSELLYSEIQFIPREDNSQYLKIRQNSSIEIQTPRDKTPLSKV